MSSYTLIAVDEDDLSRSELREYPERYDAVYLRPAVDGGWYIKNIVTVYKRYQGE